MYQRQYNCDESALKHTRCLYQRYEPTAQSSDIVSSYEQKRPALNALNYRVNCRRSIDTTVNAAELLGSIYGTSFGMYRVCLLMS